MGSNSAIVIAGGSRGLGREIGLEAFKRGFSIALLARGQKDLEAAQTEIMASVKGNDKKVSIHSVDLTDPYAVQVAIENIKKVHGGIRTLVNNAGTWMGRKAFGELNAKDIQQSLDLNFFSAFHAAKAVVKDRAQGSKEELSIINVGATASVKGFKGVAPFCVAKGALRTLSQSMARELGPEGIHVAHLVIDGLIDNERTRGINPSTPKEKFINMRSIADSILHVALQERSCWTFEWDLRPYNENW